MERREPSIQQIALMVIILFFFICLVDLLAGQSGISPGGYQITDRSFRILSDIWFYEALTLILFPIIALVYLKRRTLSLLPFIVAGLGALLISFHIVTNYYIREGGWGGKDPLNTAYRVLHSTIPYQFNADDDPSLVSPVSSFMRGQLPFIASFAVGTGLMYGVKVRSGHDQNQGKF